MTNRTTTSLWTAVRARRPQRSMLAALVAALLVLGLLGSTASAAGRLAFAPDHGPVGTAVTAQASGLTPGAHLTLVWQTADASWQVGDGAFNGVRASTVERTLGDFVVSPHLTVTPTSGPVGTPIHIRFTGLGYRFYHLAWHLLYDGGNTGILTGLSTHGTAEATIPATGTVGPHTLQVIVGTHSIPYLNEQQAPIYIPQVPLVESAVFRVTSGPAVTRSAASQDLPRTPGSAASATGGSTPSLSLDYTSGTVGSPTVLRGHGFPPASKVTLTWSTVVGNRISGAGWQESTRPFATVTSGADGGFAYRFDTPDDLGGVHHIVATAGNARAAASYTIEPSAFEVSPRTVAPGGDLTVHLKGVGTARATW
ncbi:MAG: hypothetical protein P8Y02_15110 [Deinococcales bacterium]